MINFPDSWFEDEIRSGFYVPSIMKRNWAAQIMVAKELEQVFEKHNIRWFIAAGTLLGAVRHKGFIPWDDDLDIYVLREDFIKLRAIPMEEFPAGFCWIDPKKNRNSFLTFKIANSSGNGFVSPEEKNKYCGNPYRVHIDVFVYDAVAADPEEEEFREVLASALQSALALMNTKTEDNSETIRELISDIETLRGKKFRSDIPLDQQLFDLFDHYCQYTHYTKDRHSEEVVLLPYYVSGLKLKFPAKTFYNLTKIVFEGVEFPAPVDYDTVLRANFGETYMTPSRAGNYHGYPYYDPLENHMRQDPNSSLAYPHMHENDLRAEDARSKWVSPQSKAQKLLSIMDNALLLMVRALRGNDANSVLQALQLCQNTAVELGTLLEETPGADMSATVELLEQYCDIVYQIYAAIVGDPVE